jgi:signal transduction histidine kinase/ligand-binding sensor domain-containing protein
VIASRTFIAALLTFLGWAIPCPAALAPSRDLTLSELHHTSWTSKDGVPGEILALAQTNDGYLWLGTANGLCRFDGAHFERYEPADQRFPGHIIESLLATRDGGLWIGFRNVGASFLKDGRIINYGESEGMPSGAIRAFAQSRDGTVWAATYFGLLRLVGSRWQIAGKDWNYPWSRAQTVFVDRSGTLWVAGDDGIVFLAEGKKQFEAAAERPSGPQFEVNGIVQAPDGTIWIAETSRSVRPLTIRQPKKTMPPPPQIVVGSYAVLFDDAGALWITSLGDGVGRISLPEQLKSRGTQKFTAAADVFSEKDGLSSNYVSAVLEDHEGNIWIGTNTGLDRFQQTSIVRSLLPAGSSDMMIIAGDHGDLWTAGLNRGMVHIEGRTPDVRPQPGDAAKTSGYRDTDGSLWLGGPIGIRHFIDGKYVEIALPPNAHGTWIVAIAKGQPGVIWATIAHSGVYRLSGGAWTQFGTHQGLPEGLPGNMSTDSKGQVWLGYVHDQVSVSTGDGFHTFSSRDGISVGEVMTVYEHGTHLWIGGEFGLQLFTGGRFVKINVADESSFRGINGIVETANGDLWINDSNGIVHLPAFEIEASLRDPHYRAAFKQFDYLDGLMGTSASQRISPAAVQGTDGRIWFSVTNGVVWIDPSRLRKNELVPPVHVTSLSADGHEYAELADPRLPVRTTAIRIAYTGLSLTAPERVRFRYMLEGADRDWRDAGARREAFYTNLWPGRYKFRVIASNNDGAWNEQGAALEFNILPAFYQTNWFFLLIAASVGCLVWIAYRWRIHQVAAHLDAQFEARLSERTRIAQDLHDTLLQGFISASMQLGVADRQLPQDWPAKTIVTEVLQLMRQVIEDARKTVRGMRLSGTDMDDLQLTFSRIPQELVVQQAINFRVVVEGKVRPLHPVIRDEVYRIGREAVVNAFRHSRAATVEVELEYADRELRLLVRDNGCGIDPQVLQSGRDGHWGLSGMRERAGRIGARLKVWSNAGAGTEVELSVPSRVAFRFEASPRRLRGFRSFKRRRGEEDARRPGDQR